MASTMYSNMVLATHPAKYKPIRGNLVELLGQRPKSLCYTCIMHYLGMRHKHERQVHLKKSASSPYIIFLDKLTFVVGIIGPFTVVPQIYSIFSTHSANGVSLATWLLIFIVTLPWVFYGMAHKEKSIIVSFALWEIANFLVVLGVFIYQ
jgi:uncharacterized protein with PQ loop repeat